LSYLPQHPAPASTMCKMRRNVGIYNLHMQAMGGGEKLTLVLAEHLALTHNVWLFCAEPLDISSCEKFFGVDLSHVVISPLNNAGPFWRLIEKMRGIRGPALPLRHYLQLRKLKLDIFINNSYASELICPAAQGIFMCMFPHPIARSVRAPVLQRITKASIDWIERLVTNPSLNNAIDSYSIVVAISQYSADWVRRMWHRGAEIIYPPCDQIGPGAAKQNIILHVGRFIPDRDDDENCLRRTRFCLCCWISMNAP